jgi:hypothetical protein
MATGLIGEVITIASWGAGARFGTRCAGKTGRILDRLSEEPEKGPFFVAITDYGGTFYDWIAKAMIQ